MSLGAILVLVLMVVLLPLVLNEAGELAPWLAKRLLCWAAARLGTAEACERYGEEWLANLDHVPGKITKLIWVSGLVVISVPRLRRQARRRQRAIRAARGLPARWLLPPWVVDRPAEVNQIVTGLYRTADSGITTVVHGAGGFGKTTVARIVGADWRVVRRFRSRVYWVPLGREVGPHALAALVSGLISQIQPDRPVVFTDVRRASECLASILEDGPRRLLILDDVRSYEQLAAFPIAGRSARLVTTRNPSLVDGRVQLVNIDQMSECQARALLMAGLPPLPPVIAGELLGETGRCPWLLRKANKTLTEQALSGSDMVVAADDLLGQLRRRRR
jgi:hypothetical protein